MRSMLLDRKTLLFAAEVVAEHDVCVVCGRPLTAGPEHKGHRLAVSVQDQVKADLTRTLRALAATGVDLKGRFRPRDPA